MTHKTISKSLAITCLMTTCLAPALSRAESPDLYFYPKHTWEVERISSEEKNKNPVCAVSNQLNNGYIVQIAGTTDGFTNINIDFRQDVFDTNSKYEVQYSVPGQSTKIIPTKAFSEGLLVTDLRHEQGFSEKLSDASVLDVSIQNNQFRMYLTGLGTAMEQYSKCIMTESQIAAAKIEEIKKDMPQQPLQKASSNAPMPPITVSFADQSKNAAQQKSAAKKDVPQQNLRPDGNRERYTDKMAQKLKEESKQYKPSISEKKTEAASAETIEPNASAALDNNTAEEIKTSSVTVENYKSPKAVYNIQKSEEPVIADFTEQSTPEKPEKLASMNNAAQRFAQIEPASNNGHSDDVIHMRDKISDLEDRVSMLINKNKMLDEELKTALKDASEERLSVSSDNWNLERATMRFNEAERQIMRLGRQLQSQRAQCQIEKTDLESMLFSPQITNDQQMAKLVSLEEEVSKSQADLYRKQRQYEERIRILEEQLAAQ